MKPFDRSNEECVKKIIYVLFGLIVVFITSKWLKAGFILGFAEEGITFFNTGRTVDVFNSFWLDHGLGQSTAFYFPRLPFYLLMNTVIVGFVKNWIAQNVIFGILLLLALIYVFKLVGLFQKNLVIQWSASLFYLLNLYSMSQIFNRFIILFIFLWSLLPIFLYYWIKWISKGDVVNLICFQLFSLLYSYVYGLPSSVFVLWIPSLLYVMYIFVRKKDKRLIRRSVIGLLLWILCSFWWIYPLWRLRNNEYSTMIDSTGNFNSLVEVNKYFDNKNILNLTQKYYFEKDGYFKTFYLEKPVNFALIFTSVFLFVGISFALLRKKLGYLLLLLFVGWFISKGVNPPLWI